MLWEADLLCWYLNYPRFAVKLSVPQLSLKDLMLMTADVAMSMMSLAGAEFGGMPAAVASLIDVVDQFLRIEFSIYLELSLAGSQPEWGGLTESIPRGLYLNTSASAYVFGFEFDFRCEARLQLPTPTASEALMFAADFASFVMNPMGLVTGEVTMANIPIKVGLHVKFLSWESTARQLGFHPTQEQPWNHEACFQRLGCCREATPKSAIATFQRAGRP